MAFKVERLERIFLYVTIVVLVLGVVAIVLSVAEAGIHLPTREERIDPETVRESAPFDNPGVFEVAPGEYEVVMVAQAWAFEPSEIRVPKGAEVEFIVTAVDVVHGILIWETNVNAMVIPGQVTRVSAEFNDPGEYNLVCHEFCGIGHHGMFGKVVVTE